MKAILALVVALVVTGCGLAGNAALIGSERITESQLSAEVSGVLAAQGLPADAEDAALIRKVLERMVVIELVDQFAASRGIEVTPGEIERYENELVTEIGDREVFNAAILQQDAIAPDQIEPYLRLRLQLSKLREQVGGSDEASIAAVVGYANDVGIEISPRFGTWISDILFLAPPQDVLSTED